MKSRTIIRCSLAATIIYLIWRSFFTLPLEDAGWAIVFGALLLMAEIMGAIEFISICYFMSNVRTPDRPTPPEDWYPDVDVFIATYNESEDILRTTIGACLAMDYVAGRKVSIYVCDDGRRDKVGKLCKEMGVHHLTRQDNTDAKAGNYNHALRKTRASLIANFDADMVPRRDFLMKLVPYFYISPEEEEDRKRNKMPPKKVGFVQAPQRFYNPDLFQFNLYGEKDIPNEQDFFFWEIQIGRNKCNAVICCGSNVIFSRKALEETGGYATGVITEDFATGIQIQEQGYETYAIPDDVAYGLAPLNVKNLIRQRRRWARGCIQTLYKYRLLLKRTLRLSWSQKIAYWSAGVYWLYPIRRGIYLLSPILFSLFDVPFVRCGLAELVIIALPTYILQYHTIWNISDGIRNYSLSALYESILFPSLLPAVVMEILGIKEREFHTTEKEQTEDSSSVSRALYHAFPHLVLSALNLISLVCCILTMFSTGSPIYIFIMFWISLNFWMTSMSAFFMLGRKVQRKHERFGTLAPISCVISWMNGEQRKHVSAEVNDISEGGFSIVLADPCYIPSEENLDVLLNTESQCVQARGTIISVRIISVRSGQNEYRYTFKFIENDTPERKNTLLRIIHGGKPILPSRLRDDYSVVLDWLRNLRIRLLQSPTSTERRGNAPGTMPQEQEEEDFDEKQFL